MKRNSRVPVWLLLCLTLTACSANLFRNYGRIDPNREVTAAFERYEVNADYRYFFSGPEISPNAFMGLHREYRLDPRAPWKEVAMRPERMREIVEHMKTKASEFFQFQHGFTIRDNNGRQIGVWYSILEARTFVQMKEAGGVRIDTPHLETYDKMRRDADSGN